MKKCPKCGAVLNDSRQTCVDCGTLLGKPLDEREEAALAEQLDEKLDGMSAKTEDFYVSLRDKLLGVVAALGIVAAFVLLSLVGTEKSELKNAVPEGTMVVQYTGGTTILSSGEGGAIPPASLLLRGKNLEKAATNALIALVSFVASLPLLVFPKLMWQLDTLKYRLFYNWDTTPSWYAVTGRKVAAYLFLGVGLIAILWGCWLFFG